MKISFARMTRNEIKTTVDITLRLDNTLQYY